MKLTIQYALGGLLGMLFSMHIAAAELPDFKSLVKKTSPAVVNISTEQKEQGDVSSLFPGYRADEIPEIFKHFFRSPDPEQQRPHKAPQSLGSGFIISEDGYVLTNHHVVEGAKKVIVRLSDRRELEAQIIGSDKRSDVALLKLEGNNFPVVKVGNSEALEVGEWVLAIGSPFGFDYSVTAGIVSATGRSLENETYVPFIQTDVAINPGNSGGPLFNLDGEVVGINSQIYTRSGGFMGLSFAIPIDVVMEVVEQIRDQGFVTRGWLGVIIQEVSKELAESFGLSKPSGALVAKILADGPAEKAGLQEGDVILKFNDQHVDTSADLPPLVGRVKPGETIRLSVIRSGDVRTIKVKIGALPSDTDVASAEVIEKSEAKDNPLSIVVSSLTSDQKQRWGVRSGVVISAVNAGVGADAGLMVGDVITMINGVRIDSPVVFEQTVAGLPSRRAVPMRIVRRGSPMFLPLRLK